MLVSVHIPKTGGATLLRTLRRKYGRRLLLDYPHHHNLRGKVKQTILNLAAWPPKAVHGHFPASKYEGSRLITFVRDPVERRISTYHYVHRQYENHGIIANKEWEQALSMSLHDFVALPAPTLAYFLDVGIERFWFIGRMIRFERDVALLSEMLGIPYRQLKMNAAPKRTVARDDLRRLFAQSNPEEIEIYEASARRADELQCVLMQKGLLAG
jgi:hypothetical protein